MSFLPNSLFDKLNQAEYFKQQNRRKNKGTFVFSAIAGLLGGAVALLFSPKSGKENRKYIVKKSKEVGDEFVKTENTLETKFKSFKEKLEKRFDSFKENIKEKDSTEDKKAEEVVELSKKTIKKPVVKKVVKK